MRIIGHQKTSLIDYPDKICTVFFAAGCNFRCLYCHNSHIVKGEEEELDEEEIFDFLEQRKKFIDAVCISGGEPTLYEDLPEWIGKIREKGFLIKLDTNGTNPKMLQRLLDQNLLDYVAMDVKAPWNQYRQIVGTDADVEAVRESVEILKEENRIEVEFRTTVCQEHLSLEDILKIAETLKGSRRYTIQNFRDTGTVLAGAGQLHAYDRAALEKVGKTIQEWFGIFKVR